MAAWTAINSPPTDADTWQTTAYAGKAYLTMGNTGVAVADVYEYDPGTDTYATKTACPTPLVSGANALHSSNWYHFGGFDTVGSADSDRCVVYDVVGDAWSSIANLPAAASETAAVTVGGKIYVFGGLSGTTRLDLTRIYDIAGDSWSAGAVIPEALAAVGVATDGTFIYLFGGDRPGSTVPDSNLIRRYDPATDSWSRVKTNLWRGLEWTDPVVAGGYVFVGAAAAFNGTLHSVPQLGALRLSDGAACQDTAFPLSGGTNASLVEIAGTLYGFSSGGYASLVPDPQPHWPDGSVGRDWTRIPDPFDGWDFTNTYTNRWNVWQATGYAGKAYLVFGDRSAGSADGAVVQEYDPGAETYTARATAATWATFGGNALIGHLWYHFGGYDQGSGLVVDAVSQVYDILADTWTTLAPLPHPAGDVAMVAAAGKIHVFGGYNDTDPGGHDWHQIYDPGTDTWSAGAPLPSTLTDAAAGSDGTFIYVFGGSGPDPTYIDSNVIYRYEIATDSWDVGGSLWTRLEGPAYTTTASGFVYLVGGFAGEDVTGAGGASTHDVGVFHLSDGLAYHDVPLPTTAPGMIDTSGYLEGIAEIDGVLYFFDTHFEHSLSLALAPILTWPDGSTSDGSPPPPPPPATFLRGRVALSGAGSYDVRFNGESVLTTSIPHPDVPFSVDITALYAEPAVVTITVSPGGDADPTISTTDFSIVRSSVVYLSEFPSGWSSELGNGVVADIASQLGVLNPGAQFNNRDLATVPLAAAADGGVITYYFHGVVAGARPAVVASTPCYDDELLADSPGLLWRFRETAYRTVEDLSGNGRIGRHEMQPVPWTGFDGPAGAGADVGFSGIWPGVTYATTTFNNTFPFDSTFAFITKGFYSAPISPPGPPFPAGDWTPQPGDVMVVTAAIQGGASVTPPSGWTVHLDEMIGSVRMVMTSKTYVAEVEADTHHVLSADSHFMYQARYFSTFTAGAFPVSIASVQVVAGLDAPSFDMPTNNALATWWPFITTPDDTGLAPGPKGWHGGVPSNFDPSGVGGGTGMYFLRSGVAGTYPPAPVDPAGGAGTISGAVSVLIVFTSAEVFDGTTLVLDPGAFVPVDTLPVGSTAYIFAEFYMGSVDSDEFDSVWAGYLFPPIPPPVFPGATILATDAALDSRWVLYRLDNVHASPPTVTVPARVAASATAMAILHPAFELLVPAAFTADTALPPVGSDSRSVWATWLRLPRRPPDPTFGGSTVPGAGPSPSYSEQDITLGALPGRFGNGLTSPPFWLGYGLYPGEKGTPTMPSNEDARVVTLQAVLKNGANASPLIDQPGSPICGDHRCADGVTLPETHVTYATNPALLGYFGNVTGWTPFTFFDVPIDNPTGSTQEGVYQTDGIWHHSIDIFSHYPDPGNPGGPQQLGVSFLDGAIFAVGLGIGNFDGIFAPDTLPRSSFDELYAAYVLFGHPITLTRAYAHMAHLCIHSDRGRLALGGAGVAANVIKPRLVVSAAVEVGRLTGSARRSDQGTAHYTPSDVTDVNGVVNRPSG